MTIILFGLFVIIQPTSAEENDIPETLLFLISEADSAIQQNHIDLAIQLYEEVVDVYDNETPAHIATRLVLACESLGNLYIQQGDYNRALDVIVKGIKISESLVDSSPVLANLYMNAGNVYSVFEDHEKALTYYDEALKQARLMENVELQATLLNNMTAAYCYTRNIEKAKSTSRLAATLPLNNTVKQRYFYYFNNGFIALAENKLEKAIVEYKKSVYYAGQPSMPAQYLTAAYSEIFKIYEEMDRLDSAIFYVKKYITLSEQNKFTYMQVDGYRSLSRVYEKLNNKEEALFYQNKYVVLSDSLMNQREFNRIRNKQYAYEKNKSNIYINKLHSRITTQQIILIISVVFLTVVSVLFVLLNRQKRKLQKAYEDLFERNKDLVKAETRYSEIIKNLSAPKTENKEVFSDEKEKEGSKSGGLREDQKDALLQKINLVMETTDDFCDADFSLAELAQKVESNTKYVSQIINETYGINFRSYLNDYRIKLSRKRLTDTKNYGHYTIKAIAESVGFKSQSNFILSFRKITGITPSHYQKMAQKEKS